MLKLSESEKRIAEIPVQIEQLKAENNQLLGYKQAIIDRLDEKEKAYSKKKIPTKKVKGVVPPMEVDLHIHHLTSSERGMNAHDKLNLQLDTARHKLEFAIRKRIQRIVFIHGVGEGVLRAELEYLFSRYENLKYYDSL